MKKIGMAIMLCLMLFVTPLQTGQVIAAENYSETTDHILGVAGTFNAFILGDMMIDGHGTDVEGRMAVGGNITINNFGIGSRLALCSDTHHLIIGGNVDIKGGENHSGNTLINEQSVINNFSLNHRNQNMQNPYRANVQPFFENAKQEIYQKNTQIAELTATGQTYVEYGALKMMGTNENVNTFEVNAKDLQTANGVHINVPSGSTVVINVKGSDIHFPSAQMFFNGQGLGNNDTENTRILWNMAEAGQITGNGVSVSGTILAPYANFQMQNGNINGTLIVESYKGHFEMHNHLFQPDADIFSVTPEVTDITGTKIWDGGPAEKPMIELQLYQNGSAYGDPISLANGETTYTWTDLPAGDAEGNLYKYTIDEVKVPESYTKTIDGDGLTVTNHYDQGVTEITGTKIWENGPAEKPTIELQLYQNGQAYGDPVSLTNGETAYTWTDLPQNDQTGIAYRYTIDEVKVPESYTKTISADGLTVTNHYDPGKANITGTKIWDGGPAEKPTIELQLYQNGQAYGNPVSLANGETAYTWTDLPQNDLKGETYTYTIDEVKVPESYTKTISNDGLSVTNHYDQGVTEITGTKIWDGGPAEKPTIELQLYQNGQAYGDPISLADGETAYTWDDLPLNDRTGVAYQYTIDEVAVPESYTKTISEDGLTITNHYDQGETEITGTKVWIGGPDEKPTIELQLYQNGEPYGQSISLENGQETCTWTNLPERDVDGQAYHYTIDETKGSDLYTKDVSEDGLTVTNTFNKLEDPTDPTDPIDPTDPTDPADPIDPADPDPATNTDPGTAVQPVRTVSAVNQKNEATLTVGEVSTTKQADEKPHAKLPQTGDQDTPAIAFAVGTGLLLIALAGRMRRN